MKMKGRMMLLLTLIVAVALSAISYKGIGSKKALSVHRIEQGLDLSGGVAVSYTHLEGCKLRLCFRGRPRRRHCGGGPA